VESCGRATADSPDLEERRTSRGSQPVWSASSAKGFLGCLDMSGQVRLLDLATETTVVLDAKGAPTAKLLAVAPGGELFALALVDRISVRDWSGKERHVFEVGETTALAFASSGVLVSGHGDGTALVWSLTEARK